MFSKNILDKLNNLSVIKEIEIGKKPITLPERIKKMIIKKRETDKMVRQSIVPTSEFNRARSEVKKTIKQHRRREYLNHIKKGIEYLKR